MVVLAMVPFLAAYGRIFQVQWTFYVALLLLSIPFLLFASAIGSLLVLSLMRFFPAARVRDTMLVVVLLLVSGIVLLIRWIEPEKLVNPDRLEIVLEVLHKKSTEPEIFFHMLPEMEPWPEQPSRKNKVSPLKI